MSDLPHASPFTEVGDRCWVARFDFLDVNVGLVGGERGVLLVDTLASEVQARRMLEEVRRLGAGPVLTVVNTHLHFDHTFGNVVLTEEYGDAELVCHDAAAADLPAHAAAAKAQAAEDSDPRSADVAAARVVVPSTTFSSAKVVDLGDRLVELIHPGRGHTAGDAIVRVGDADVLYAGDLVEESALRNEVPGFGDDCYPMEWPGTLDLVVSMLTADSTVVPGHGAPVDLDFVHEQRSAIGVVAETIRDLASRGVPLADALDATEWPYPREELTHAVARGYAHLPRSPRSLPLL